MTNAIEMTNISLHFPKGQGLLSGLVNAFRDNNSVKNRYTALKGIDLQVHQGEVLGVIGRNGSGKSTLLRIMAGIYRPDQGQVKVRGATSLLAGVNVGFNQNLTGRENVHLYGSILGHRKEKIDEILPDILEFSEIGEFMDQPLRTYSSGMKARLGIAIASAIEPEILLIDEVLGVGDPQFREKSKKRILDLVKSTGTVVMVSHSFGLMKEICDRVVLVDKGGIVCVGEATEVIAAYYDLG